MATDTAPPFAKTTCILCESNCGIEVRVEDGRFTRIKGNKAHVGSKGYTCEKALRLDHYQNHRTRLDSPLRRRADGTYEPWRAWPRSLRHRIPYGDRFVRRTRVLVSAVCVAHALRMVC